MVGVRSIITHYCYFLTIMRNVTSCADYIFELLTLLKRNAVTSCWAHRPSCLSDGRNADVRSKFVFDYKQAAGHVTVGKEALMYTGKVILRTTAPMEV